MSRTRRHGRPTNRPTVRYTVRGFHGRVDPPTLPQDPPPSDTPEAIERARFEADQARAEALKLKKELDDIRKQLPTQEERARWAELEQQHLSAEEQRRRKEGEFDQWRVQIQEKHSKELDAIRQVEQNARALAEKAERELNDNHVVQAFYGATEWFGPTGKTTMLPDVAKAYFANHVEVEVVPAPNGGAPRRRVVVRDHNGTVLVDPKTGQPLPFDKAIGELIDSHPSKAYLLRNSGRVGSGSAGGNGEGDEIKIGKLSREDFKRPEVRAKVRQSLEAPGGLQIGPGFDAIRRANERK